MAVPGGVQVVHAGIGMAPRMDQRLRIERSGDRSHLFELEQPRSRRDQQAQRELDRRHVLDQTESGDRVQHREPAAGRRPRRERDERRMQRDAGVAAQPGRAREILAGVALVEALEDAVVHRLHRARHQQAAGRRELGQYSGVANQVLDLDRDVVAQLRMLRVQRAHQRQRVTGSVQEVRVAERDVARAGAHLAADVLEHDGARDDAEPPAVDGHDRTVPAGVPAAATRFRVTRDAGAAIGKADARVAAGSG